MPVNASYNPDEYIGTPSSFAGLLEYICIWQFPVEFGVALPINNISPLFLYLLYAHFNNPKK